MEPIRRRKFLTSSVACRGMNANLLGSSYIVNQIFVLVRVPFFSVLENVLVAPPGSWSLAARAAARRAAPEAMPASLRCRLPASVLRLGRLPSADITALI